MNSVVVGTRGEGKSTLALWLAYESHVCVVVFDPRAQFDGHIVTTPEELEDEVFESRSCEEDGQPVVYRFDGESEAAFGELAGVLFPPTSQGERGGFALVIDEAGELQSANMIDPDLRRAIARHPLDGDERVHIIQTSHRLAEFSGKTKTVMDHLYVFRSQNPRDLQVLVDFTDSPELVDVVRNLPPHHLVHYVSARREDGGPQWEVWDDPTMWHMDMIPPIRREPLHRTLQ